MTQTLTVGDVKSTLQIVEGLAVNFSKMAKLAGDSPEMQALLDTAWKDVQALERLNIKMDALVAGAQAAMAEMARQRDVAITELKLEKRAGEELAKRILAGQIAVDGDIPVTDVMRVLDVLSGNTTTFEEPRLETLYEAIQDLAGALLEEQLVEAFDAEDVAEDE